MNPSDEVPELLRPSGGWGRRMDALGRALGHHLNGRANALSGLVEVLERGGGDETITGHLRAEADRVARVAGLLRVALGPVGEEDVVTLSRLTTDAMALGSLEDKAPHLEPGRLVVDADAAVRTDPTLLARLLLLLRARVARRCRPGTVRVAVGKDGTLARVEMSGEVAEDGSGPASGTLGTGGGAAGPDGCETAWSELAAAAPSVPGVEALVRETGEGVERYRLTLRALG